MASHTLQDSMLHRGGGGGGGGGAKWNNCIWRTDRELQRKKERVSSVCRTQTMLRTNAGPRPRDAGTSNRALRRDNQSGNGESSERYWNVNGNTIILLKFAPTSSPFCHLVPHFRMPREQETILTIERSPPPRRQRTRTPLFIKQNEHTRRLIPVWVFQKKLNGWRVWRHSKL